MQGKAWMVRGEAYWMGAERARGRHMLGRMTRRRTNLVNYGVAVECAS